MMNKSIFDVKQLKMNKFINSMRQLIVSTSNSTLEVACFAPAKVLAEVVIKIYFLK